MKRAGKRLLYGYLSIIVACVGVVLAPAVANAHILKTDGATSAELHIKPDDKPVAGTPVNFVLSFEKTEPGFSLQNCDCTVAFRKYGATIATKPLAATGATISDNTFTFPEGGEYTFHVTGFPKNGATFTSFALDYTEYIAKGAGEQAVFSPVFIGGIVVGALVLLGAGTLAGRHRRMRRES